MALNTLTERNGAQIQGQADEAADLSLAITNQNEDQWQAEQTDNSRVQHWVRSSCREHLLSYCDEQNASVLGVAKGNRDIGGLAIFLDQQ